MMNQNSSSDDMLQQQRFTVDKTIDEKLVSDSSQFEQQMGQQNIGLTRTYNPNAQVILPSGAEKTPLGSGVIVGVLGAGGMARVYKIWNEKLEVFRAVKILLPGTQQKELASRFDTEAKITAKLHHPNIVEIYNIGDWNGLPYIEMELIDGASLDSVIGRFGRLPDTVCSAIGMQIASALAYAHDQEYLIYGKTYKGIIHRDLKPANIMIASQGHLKLMDFGIARPTEAGLHTMEGHIVGTLQYLSPEQLDGIEIDRRSDIYSFGAILYETLTGAKTFPQATLTNLMKMKATNAYRKFQEMDFHTNPALSRITEKCLMIDRNTRYNDAGELYGELKKVYESLTDLPPGDLLRQFIAAPQNFQIIQKRRKKFPLPLLISGIAVTVICAFVGAFFLFGGDKVVDLMQKPDKVPSATPPRSTVQTPPTQKQPAAIVATETTQPEEPAEKIPETVEKPVKQSTPARLPKPATPVVSKPKDLPVESVRPPQKSPSDALKQKYGLNNLVDIGETACHKGNFTDAITALEAAQENTPKKSLYLMWAYVETRQFARARDYSASFTTNDAFIELLNGRIEAALGSGRKALNFYQTALTKPSAIKDRISIRDDALYYTALLHDQHYRESPSAETRLQAMTAWNNLKKVYSATPENPRFKLANQKLADQ